MIKLTKIKAGSYFYQSPNYRYEVMTAEEAGHDASGYWMIYRDHDYYGDYAWSCKTKREAVEYVNELVIAEC